MVDHICGDGEDFGVPAVPDKAVVIIRSAIENARHGDRVVGIRILARVAEGFRFKYSMTYFQIFKTVRSIEKSLTLDEWEFFMYEADTGSLPDNVDEFICWLCI